MCELFALSSRLPARASFSLQGFWQRGGATGDHVDGWGLAVVDGPNCEVVVDAGAAARSAQARRWAARAPKGRQIIAHVRKATQGAVRTENCHPFVRRWAGRHWVFAHNGDLKDFHPLLRPAFRPEGETDSERAFCWLMQKLRDEFGDHPARLPDWPLLATRMAPWIREIADHGRLNLLLSDGHALLAHASTQLHWLERHAPFRSVRLRDAEHSLDLAIHNSPHDHMSLVATQPLTHDEPWQAFAPQEIRLFAQGRSAWVDRPRTF